MFFSLYIKTLDRLFGEDVARTVEVSTANMAWTKGTPGGWLKALASVSQLGSSESSKMTPIPTHPLGRGINLSYLESLPYPLCSILQKLAPESAMFEILSRIQGGCEIKLSLLPPKLHMFITDHPLYPYVQARNHQFFMTALLKYNSASSQQVSFFSYCSYPIMKIYFYYHFALINPFILRLILTERSHQAQECPSPRCNRVFHCMSAEIPHPF